MVATLTGQPNRIPLFAWVAAAALLFSGLARADEKEDRDRKARAVLALTAPASPKVAAAPAPKAKSVAYGDAYKRASAEQQPLVVYVRTPMEPVPGAVVSWADSFGDTKGPAVVVGYPVGDRLYVHATLPGAPTAEAVQREVKAAAKKADPKPMPPREVKDSPAPRPLDWQIRADGEEQGACVILGESTAKKLGLIPASGHARTELDVLRDASVRVWCGDAGGSGTVVFAEPGRSVIVTAAHVVDRGGAVEVRAGGKPLPAKVILTDRDSDWAALEVARELPAVVAVGDDVRAGDAALLIGGSSVWTRGVVVRALEVREPGSQQWVDTWLIDYPSTSGDSGGGVFVRGQLVAVHVGRYGKGGEYARAPRHFAAFCAKAIRHEPVAPSKSAATLKDSPATLNITDCPTGTCPLKPSPFAGPVVIQGGCANGQCDAPSYGRGGLFRRR